jgi:hypothetical protein
MNANSMTRRVLVIANEHVEAAALAQAIGSPHPQPEVLVVAPALNDRFRRWTSDDDEAYEAAEQRLVSCIDDLECFGYSANGMIGDADPLLATAEALRLFRADTIVIATHRESRANWLARNLVARARERFDLPVVPVITDAKPQPPEQDQRTIAA